MDKNFSQYTSLSNHYGTLFNQMTILQMYEFPKNFFYNKDVLDLGCNVGRGLGLISEKAKSVVGVDINIEAINIAKEIYKENNKISLFHGDAENLPENIGMFDTILIFQTIYLINVKKLIENIKKILKKNGHVIIMSINPDRKDFNPAKYAVKYHKIEELSNLFLKEGFQNEVYGSIHDDQIIYRSKFNQLIKFIKIIASQLRLIPKNYKLKKMLKRIFFGKLIKIPDDVREFLNVKYIAPRKLKKIDEYKDYICFYLISKFK